jgi:acyl-CoA synthetase (AMP-forming)/AMP-acid ligase II
MSNPNSLYEALRRSAQSTPGQEFLRIAGQTFTCQETLDRVEATARGLRGLGVEPGDRVGVMCDNRPEAVWAWLGANAARAIDVPFNAEVRGRLLDYLVGDAAPRVLIGPMNYLEILAETITYDPQVVVTVGGDAGLRPFGDRARHITFEELLDSGSLADEELPLPGPGEIATIMYTPRGPRARPKA